MRWGREGVRRERIERGRGGGGGVREFRDLGKTKNDALPMNTKRLRKCAGGKRTKAMRVGRSVIATAATFESFALSLFWYYFLLSY